MSIWFYNLMGQMRILCLHGAGDCDIPHPIREKVFETIYVRVPFNLIDSF